MLAANACSRIGRANPRVVQMQEDRGSSLEQRHENDGAGLAEAFAGKFSLRHPAVRTAALNFGAYGASQAMRFGANLVLARLLVPEDFGLMLLVNLVLHGLEMFSDIGLGPGLIQHREGDSPRYLHTAWTLGLIRGVTLWGMAAALAWPLATLYDEPRLLAVLPVAAFSLVLDAGCSAYVVVLERRMQVGRLMLIELGSYAASVALMVGGALWTTTVWPLVAGALFNAGLSTVLTHVALGGPRMRLHLDREAAAQLMTFGRWLFLSSILTFVAGQLDRIILGKLLSVSELGVYSIAFMMAQVMVALTHELARSVLYPVYARSGELGPDHLRAQVRRYRIALLAVTLPPLLLLYLAGPEIVRFLYDTRYWDAGWMVQILAVGAMLSAIMVPAESVLVACGDSFRHMLLQGIGAVTMAGCMAGGYGLGGTPGLIVGFSLAGLAQYPFLAMFIRPRGVWIPKLDLAAGLAVLIALAAITQARGMFPLWPV